MSVMQAELIDANLPPWGSVSPGELTAMPGSGVQLIDADQLPVIDSVTLSARARICTPRQDRQGDVIEPSGVDWSDYANIGVVKYEHGFTGIVLPIAKSFDPSGNLTLEYSIDEDAIYARSYFSERFELSAQMFGLIEEGFLRATSIHVIPLANGFVARSDGHYVKCSSMLEYSWCTVGVNPGAYAKALTADSKVSQALALQLESATRILNRGTIGNRRLLPALAKCLRAVEPTRERLLEFGWTNNCPAGEPREHSDSDGEAMGTKVLTSEEIAKLTPMGLAKALAEPQTWDAETVKQLRFKAKSMDSEMELPDEMAKGGMVDETLPKGGMTDEYNSMAKAEEPEPAVETSSTSSQPLGAQYLSNLHAAMSSTLASAIQELMAVENPDVKNGVQPIVDDITAKLAELEGLYGKIYPEQPALVPAADEAESAETLAKSWAAQPRSQYQLDGLATRLTAVASLPPAKAKSVIAATVRDLRLLGSQAKSFKPPVAKPSGEFVPKAEYDALKVKHEELRGKTQKLVNKLKGAPADLPTA